MDVMLLPFRRYAQFAGRSSRSEYWMFLLFISVVSLILALIGTVAGPYFAPRGIRGRPGYAEPVDRAGRRRVYRQPMGRADPDCWAGPAAAGS